MIKYAQDVFNIKGALSVIRDSRPLPRIPTSVIARSAFSMFLSRLGSLNALEQLENAASLRTFLEAKLPSADTIGRVASLMNPSTIRHANKIIYTQLKRNKALDLLEHGCICSASTCPITMPW